MPETIDRGCWPHHYGRCGLDPMTRSDIARWAYYNLGAHMTTQRPGDCMYPAATAPRCVHCGARSIGAPIVGRCDTCRDANRAPQGEAVRLFTPAPAQLPGQTTMGV